MSLFSSRHLTKLYDSLAKLKFNHGTKIARGMFAKDGEYVEFKGICDCSGLYFCSFSSLIFLIFTHIICAHSHQTVGFIMQGSHDGRRAGSTAT